MKTKDTNDLIEIMDQIRRITNTLAEKDAEIRLLRQENERLYKTISEISKPTPTPDPLNRNWWIRRFCSSGPRPFIEPHSPTFTCEKHGDSSNGY
jgi:hypothetical protein